MKELTTESLEQALINMMTAVDDKGERIDLRPTHYYKENKMKDRVEEIFDQVMNEDCPDPLRRFAELVAADEREACAKVCESRKEYFGYSPVYAYLIRIRKQA